MSNTQTEALAAALALYPLPWRVEYEEQIVAANHGGRSNGFALIAHASGELSDETPALLNHVVVCVNACSGADTANLQARPYEAIRKDLLRTISEAHAAEAQRDELLTALRALHAECAEIQPFKAKPGRAPGDVRRLLDAYDNAEKVIARIRGGA